MARGAPVGADRSRLGLFALQLFHAGADRLKIVRCSWP
jgi:hypothetical protein